MPMKGERVAIVNMNEIRIYKIEILLIKCSPAKSRITGDLY